VSTSFRLCWTDKLYQRSCCDKFVQKKLCVKLYLEKVVMTNLSSKVRCQKLFPGNYMHNFLLWKILCTKIMYISYSFPKVESYGKKIFPKKKESHGMVGNRSPIVVRASTSGLASPVPCSCNRVGSTGQSWSQSNIFFFKT